MTAVLEQQRAHGFDSPEAAIAQLQAVRAGLADAYERIGRSREALATLRKADALKEEMSRQEREKAVSEAQEKFSAERKDHEIERLSLENAHRQAEVSARTWQQRLWAAAAVALALGLFLLIQIVKRTRSRNRELEVNNAALSEQSVHDPLTGAFNRRHCHVLMNQQEALLLAKSRDRKYSACAGLAVLEVDHFKSVNDTYGHVAGDEVLVEIAHRLQGLLRQQDTVVRWGGEEFVLILPGTPPDGIAILIERALHAIAGEPMTIGHKPVWVTVSAGCVAYPLSPGEHWEDALQVADFAMYLAEQRGRNRAVCLMQIAEGVRSDAIKGDLALAEAAGHVVLKTIQGPRGVDR